MKKEIKSLALPSVTIFTGTFNSNPGIFTKVLRAIKNQNYPKSLIEHIVLDSGSTNGTVELAKKYGCKVVSVTLHGIEQQKKVPIAIEMAKGRLILILESDNIILGKDWLQKMVKPFLENKKVFCTFSAYNGYFKDMPLTTKYCGLFGSPDPTLYYLNKTEKIPLINKKYNKGETIEEFNDYYVVRFNRENLPTLGDNGHMFLKDVIRKTLSKEKRFLHTDAFAELLDLGYDTFGVIKNSIIHVQNSNLLELVKRRVEVKEDYSDNLRGQRSYLVYNPDSINDRKNLIKYIIFSITFVIPFMESLRGYLKIREKAWFLHPLLCFLMVYGYGSSEIKRRFTLSK